MALIQKIVGGEYDFERNVLKLEVSLSDTSSQNNEAVYTQWREFDVTSLKISSISQTSSKPIEVLGARTHEGMQKIMPSLIRTFQQMSSESVEHLLSKSNRAEAIATKKTVALKAGVKVDDYAEAKRLEEAGQQLSALPKKQVGRVEISSSDLIKDHTGTYRFTEARHGMGHIDNLEVMQDLLKASHWQDMIADVENTASFDRENRRFLALKEPDFANHDWTSSTYKNLKHTQKQLSSVLNQFEKSDLLNEACLHYQNHILTQKPAIQEQYRTLDSLQQEAKNRLARVVNSGDVQGEQLHQLQERVNAQNQAIEIQKGQLTQALYYIQKTLPSLHREIAIILSMKELARQKLIDCGQAPLGSDLSQEWDDIVSGYSLVPTNGDTLENHLRRQLGLRFPTLNNLPSLVDEINTLFAPAETPSQSGEDNFVSAVESMEEDVETPHAIHRRKKRSDIALENQKRDQLDIEVELSDEKPFNLLDLESRSSSSLSRDPNWIRLSDIDTPPESENDLVQVEESASNAFSPARERPLDEATRASERVEARKQANIEMVLALLQAGQSAEDLRQNAILAPFVDLALEPL